ncbi:DoxX family protein [Streptosporangium sp. NBC_01810]|uniref:DoxX family protein n=1 Tax=Streptosporangium sp. NBC_01810 TaxID=2975951 RepID=UPI002DDC3BB6|nr:DoxX family protein [Streptosporangium sp. NBC_01810]WSA28300.1 DoxX family protein [Streptosporangium sp. NBC_01810]
MAELVSAASHQGADPVASGESFVAGYPLWGGVLPAVRQHTLYEEEEGEATSPSYSIRAPGRSPPVPGARGGLEILGAVGLVIGLWIEGLGIAAAAGLALLMAGAVLYHVKARDTAKNTSASLVLLVLSVVTIALRLASL